ncbi:hypothetical protein V2A60_000672 [Cordyceps javanica]
MPPKKFSRDDYKVAWICPLEVEEIAALEMLDEEHESLNVPPTDSNIYHLGAINSHNVVIIGLPRPGNCPAATVITQMKMTFPNLKYGLLVGIGGGVPVETDRGMIRLGHVVVSEPTGTHSGAVQYDHGKAKTGEFERTGYLQPPPTALLNAARELSVQRQRMDVDPVWSNTQRIDTSRSRFRHFKFPGVTNDSLYQPDYEHRQKGSSCEDCGCDPKQRIEPSIDEFNETFVTVHRGTVASGELVLRKAKKRDYLARKYGVLCFETEAAGASTDFPCMVIRGISDYCDSHKNDVWHGYAAAVAAAYARQLFFHMSVEEETGSSNPTPHAFELPCDLTEIAAVHYFVAREYELEQMHKLLSGPDGRLTAILYGTGGMGKTQLAIEYMRRYSCDYPVAIWLNAKNEITLKRSFARVAERIQRLQPSLIYFAAALESRDLDDTWKAVKRWLEEPMNKRWIVTYDNYDDPLDSDVISVCPSHATGADPNGKSQGNEGTVDSNAFDIRPYLPKASHGSIIVTTRSSLVTFGPCIKVDKLEDVNDSLEILVQASRRESLREDPDAIKLVQRLDGLPLAIATAGAYLDQIAMRCDEYLQLYHDSWLQLQKKSPRLTYYDQTLYSTWNISYSRIEQQSPVAAKLLRQWAYFSNEDLWYELLKEGGSHGVDWLQELTGMKFEFDDIMRILCNHGLVAADLATCKLESVGYSVHGCVHEWMIHVLNPKQDNAMALTAMRCIASRVPAQGEDKLWIIRRRLFGHAERCMGYMSKMKVPDEDALALDALGSLYMDQSPLEKLQTLCERSLEVPWKAPGLHHTSTTNAAENLSGLHNEQGWLQTVKAIDKQALDDYEKTLGPDDISTLDTVSKLGAIYYERGWFQKAEAMHQRALDGYEKAFGPDHKATLRPVYGLGLIYLNLGWHQKAEAMYQRGLDVCEKASDSDNPFMLVAFHVLGALYFHQGRPQESAAMYERERDVGEKAFGPNDLLTLRTDTLLGSISKDQGRLQEAKAMYQRTLDGYGKMLGPDHPLTRQFKKKIDELYL